MIGPFAGVVAAVAVGAGAFPLARLVYAARYRWGAVSVSRVGLEAFVRQYASSRGLELHDRWRLLRTVAGSDRFRARVGELMREVIARG